MGLLKKVVSAATQAANPIGQVAETLSTASSVLETLSATMSNVHDDDLMEMVEDLVTERVVDHFGVDATIQFLEETLEDVKDIKRKQERTAARRARRGSPSIEAQRQAFKTLHVPPDAVDMGDGIFMDPQFHKEIYGDSDPVEFDVLLPKALQHEEGVVYESYLDTGKVPHGGCGHKLSQDEVNKYPIGTPIPKDVVQQWFETDCTYAEHSAKSIIGDMWETIDVVRQVVITSMVFQFGAAGLRGFDKFLKAVRAHRWMDAAYEMTHGKGGGPSLWIQQTEARCKRAAHAMDTGRPPKEWL